MSEDKTGLSITKRAERAERNRVREMLARDRADAEREEARIEATNQVASGNFANIEDTVNHPTPEWLAKGPVERFTPKSLDNTSRSVRSVRRSSTPVVTKLWSAGKLEMKSAAACLRYRDDWDVAAMGGKYSSNSYSMTASIKAQSPNGAMIFTDEELIARDRLRHARGSMDGRFLEFFHMIVIDDIPIRQAARHIKCRNGKEVGIFCKITSSLAEYYEAVGVELVYNTERSVS